MSKSKSIINLEHLEFRIVVSCPDFLMPLKVKLSERVLDVKKRLGALLGISDTKDITLRHHTRFMEDNQSVRECGLFKGTKIVMTRTVNPAECLDLNITVSCPAFRMPLKVNQSERVLDLKKRIGDIWGITNTNHITLRHLTLVMEDYQSLQECYIYEGTEIVMTRTGYKD
ncbi:hypothetical protein HS088_TW06G00219 [Tripterygium wilfordii]|uniref:Ubiquitin-like domain-containing protein n=1 Tax=Tripterygium wilfordii TaxID=458696 RepID=A0A7J7DIJ5_TRIWF|nr:uncharacterized protein LOC119999365 [Tripterygium wilfordii]XP_038702801.1 uncharacterized protein LOC119999365 [Tripterygium wilfordii]XP_038702802.1 uncharacterized protein LOC119999365 [Tripterygium wilfordii]XP_038702803.1 uncharacterized protein LOC119999365 [Tripterygium wilfordii]KAF5746054.1 hypothetical protein HS088_TW06G00219 [Tripterygium wilfordii]